MNDRLATQPAALDVLAVDPLVAARVAVDAPEYAQTLPGDHPAWPRDVLSISSRARAVIATLRPIAVAVLGFWDHPLRAIGLGVRTLGVDASGCYRLR